MKAARFYGANQPLRLEEIEQPAPQPKEVLVKVTACGLCHTDLHYLDHGVRTFKQPPITLGHEVSGIVEEAGGNVKNLKKGDRVIVPPVFTCGECEMCRTGRENICKDMIMLGNNIDGAYAEYVVAPAKDTIPLPASIPLAEGSIISDAISTPYHALANRAMVKPGNSIAIYGCGGLGINAVQVAKALGAYVIAVDIKEKKLQYAKEFGADEVLKSDADTAKKIRKLTGGGVDFALEAIGNPETMQIAFSTIRTGGTLIVMGYSDKDLTINAGRIMYREMRIMGTLGCPPYLYPSLIKLIEMGKIKVKELVTHKFPLNEINEAFSILRENEESLIRAIILC